MKRIISNEENHPANVGSIDKVANKNVLPHTKQDNTDHMDRQDGPVPTDNAKDSSIRQEKIISLSVPAVTVDEAMEWVEQTDPDKIAGDWVNKVQVLDAAGQDAVKQAVSNKTGIKLRPLNAELKAAAVARKQKKVVSLNKKQSKMRKAKMIVEIEVDDANTREVTLKAAKAIVNDTNPGNDLILRYGSELVSIQTDSPKTVRGVTQLNDKSLPYPKMPVIQTYVTNTLRHRLEQSAAYLIRDPEKGDRRVQWPKHIVDGIGQQKEVKFPPLTGIVPHPFVGVDGTVIAKQGYDKATGLFVEFDPDLCKGLPQRPTKNDVKQALTFLTDEVLADFPFAGRTAKIAAVSALLTALQRKVIADDSGCPGFLFDAPTQATGKTTLAQLISYSIYGRPAAATSWSDNDTEMGKHILAMLREGHSSVLYDNLPEGSYLKSNELAKAMTGNSYSGRVLGTNKTATVPSNILWLFTGNNIAVCGDFNSRILSIRLDSRVADPDRRVFKRPDVGKWCMEHRAAIIKACLTIINADCSAIPDTTKPTRFPSWDKYVRLPLFAASGVDVADLFQRNKTTDPELEFKQQFLEAMYDEYDGKAVTAKKICKDVCEAKTNASGLKDVFSDVFPENSTSSKALGKWFGKLKGQVIGGYRLTATTGTTGENKNRSAWAVEKLDDEVD